MLGGLTGGLWLAEEINVSFQAFIAGTLYGRLGKEFVEQGFIHVFPVGFVHGK